MKNIIFRLGISITMLALLAACNNPFWPIDINEGSEKTAQEPVITVQPVSRNYPVGYPDFLEPGYEGVPLSVEASVTDGGVLSYQWFKASAVNSYIGAEIIDGATNSTFLPPTDENDSITFYFVEVTNTLLNGKSAKKISSNIVTVMVHTPQYPNIEGHPQNDAALKGASIRPLIVLATSEDAGTLSYQWYSNTTPSNEGGTLLIGQTRYFLNLDTSEAGTFYYYVEVTNTWSDYGRMLASDVATVIISETTVTEPQVINFVTVEVTEPELGEEPENDAIVTGYYYSVQSVRWEPNDDYFAGSETYTVIVTVKANANYTFGDTEDYDLRAYVNGRTAVNGEISADETEFTFSFTFPVTDAKSISRIEIETQPTNLTYNHGSSLNLAGLQIRLVYDDNTSEVNSFSNLIMSHPALSAAPGGGSPLDIPTHNGQPVVITYGELDPVSTNNLTINPAPITEAHVQDVIAPATGNVPNTSATTTSELFTVGAGTVSWTPGHNPFQGNTAYTANVTLTAKEYFTFTSGLTTVTINGTPAQVASNNGNTAVISQIFTMTLTKEVTGITMETQPTKLNYRHSDLLDLTGLSVKLTYNDSTDAIIQFANFGANGISTEPLNGTVMLIGAHNDQPVVITHSSLPDDPVNTSNLTVIKALPTVNWPTGYTANLGDNLGAAALTPPENNGSGTLGIFTWKAGNATLVGNVGTNNHTMVFTPSDGSIFETLENPIQVTVKGPMELNLFYYNPVTDKLEWSLGAEYDPDTKTIIASRGTGISLTLANSNNYGSIKWTINPDPNNAGENNTDTFTYLFDDDYNEDEIYIVSLTVGVDNGSSVVPYNRTIRIKVVANDN